MYNSDWEVRGLNMEMRVCIVSLLGKEKAN